MYFDEKLKIVGNISFGTLWLSACTAFLVLNQATWMINPVPNIRYGSTILVVIMFLHVCVMLPIGIAYNNTIRGMLIAMANDKDSYLLFNAARAAYRDMNFTAGVCASVILVCQLALTLADRSILFDRVYGLALIAVCAGAFGIYHRFTRTRRIYDKIKLRSLV